MKGVIAFLSAKDVPGKNLAIDSKNKEMLMNYDEKVRKFKNFFHIK